MVWAFFREGHVSRPPLTKNLEAVFSFKNSLLTKKKKKKNSLLWDLWGQGHAYGALGLGSLSTLAR